MGHASLGASSSDHVIQPPETGGYHTLGSSQDVANIKGQGVDQDDVGYYTTQSTIGTPISAPTTSAQIVRLDTLTHQEDPLPPDVPMPRDSASFPRSGWEPKKP
ncbi:hypothetical protein B296_00026301 [Ensete ventricosum]|uniref:Uncharacterized protein n=1 Tax=Ensete ventricosum TaxID=4639 RepID=A0A426ZPC5_ENSVE|nr:hypothetical protein B296_00026301 [Ensete ventricosum]